MAAKKPVEKAKPERKPPERKPPQAKSLHPIAAARLTNRRRTR